MVQEHMKLIGKTGYVRLDDLRFAVKVLDARQAYGHIRYLVTPVAGHGERWTENVTFDS